MSTLSAPKSTLYFGYGSNLWKDQMKQRCPSSRFVGIGTLKDWLWIINSRQYANIVPSSGNIVYGALYEVDAEDEARLDVYEGVPTAYQKQHLLISFSAGGLPSESANYAATGTATALVYVDSGRTGGDFKPKEEYISRMNAGIKDLLESDPAPEVKAYVEKYLRPYIPSN